VGRAAAREVDPGTAPLRAAAPPDLPVPALAELRQAMSREAGVVRDAAGLGRLICRIDALEAAHGRSAPLVAARLIAACALARRESRGAHFRLDAEPQAEPRRTFLTFAEIDAPCRFAAE
jgi:L-aspartate oxidase